jgi:hypothetical protein
MRRSLNTSRRGAAVMGVLAAGVATAALVAAPPPAAYAGPPGLPTLPPWILKDVQLQLINQSATPLPLEVTFCKAFENEPDAQEACQAPQLMPEKNELTFSMNPGDGDGVKATIKYPAPAGNLQVFAGNDSVHEPYITVNGEKISLVEGEVQARRGYNFPFTASRKADTDYAKQLVLELFTPNV